MTQTTSISSVNKKTFLKKAFKGFASPRAADSGRNLPETSGQGRKNTTEPGMDIR